MSVQALGNGFDSIETLIIWSFVGHAWLILIKWLFEHCHEHIFQNKKNENNTIAGQVAKLWRERERGVTTHANSVNYAKHT